jgi:hypothetical protein
MTTIRKGPPRSTPEGALVKASAVDVSNAASANAQALATTAWRAILLESMA